MFNNSNSNIIGASGSWEKYTVKAGDTLSGIAAKFHTTVFEGRIQLEALPLQGRL